MAEWSAGLYSGFDMLLEVFRDWFLSVDLSGLKAE